MSRAHRQALAALAAGALFGVGLAVSGMTEPANILGFLDVTGGAWRPALLLVMVGALAVHALAYRWVKGRPSPLFAERFVVPTRRDLDARLWIGAAIFGVGWGLAGYCPGPGVASLVSGSMSAIVFVLAMVAGMVAVSVIERARTQAGEVRGEDTNEPRTTS